MSTLGYAKGFTVLGETSIRKKRNQLTVPEPVVDADILQLGLKVFWGYSDEDEVHVLLQDPSNLYMLQPRPTHTTTLTARRCLTVPKCYFDDFTGSKSPVQRPRPEEERFEYGQDLVFATADWFREWSACLLLPTDHPSLTDAENEPY